MALPKWMTDKPVRSRSVKAEKKLAKQVGGKTTANSGATLGQNDVFNNDYEFEHKMTRKNGFTFTLDLWKKLFERTKTTRIPVVVIEFEDRDKKFVVLDWNDFVELNNG